MTEQLNDIPESGKPEVTGIDYKTLSVDDLINDGLYELIYSEPDGTKQAAFKANCRSRAKKLGIVKDFDRRYSDYESRQKENAAEVIDSASDPTVKRGHGSETVLYSRPYMYSKDGKTYQVIKPLLHEYIRQSENYIFARSNARNTVQMYIYRNGVYRHISENDFKGVIRSYLPLLHKTTSTINEVNELFKMDSDRYVRIDDLNGVENIINFKNGLLHIDSMKMSEHSPKIFSTIQIPVDYNKDEPRPSDSVFEKYMDELTEGDTDKRETLLQFMGATISNVCGYRAKKALFIIGKGDSGKSQIKGLLDRIIGEENCSCIDICGLEERFGISSLYGKRLAGTNDMSYAGVKSLVIFKQAVSGDLLRAEFKHESDFEFRFKGVFIFCANKMPRFSGDRGAWVYDRMTIISANNVVSQEKQDKYLVDKMLKEKSYIVRLCAEALQRWIRNNYRYHEGESSRIEMRKYKIVNDSVLTFCSECTEPRPEKETIKDWMTCGRIYEYYKLWSQKNNGGYSETSEGFNNTLTADDKGERIKTNGGNEYYTKFWLTESFISEYAPDRPQNVLRPQQPKRQ